MSFTTKIAVIFVCLLICAMGMFIIPREAKAAERSFERGTPVLLHGPRPIRGLRI